jgi:hypothetical protein
MGSAGTVRNFQLPPLSRLYKKIPYVPLLYTVYLSVQEDIQKKGKGFSRGVSTSVGIPFRCFEKAEETHA